jgi:hypothetical protein
LMLVAGWKSRIMIDRYTQGHGRGAGQSEPCPPVARRPAVDLGHRRSGHSCVVHHDAEPRSAAR